MLGLDLLLEIGGHPQEIVDHHLHVLQLAALLDQFELAQSQNGITRLHVTHPSQNSTTCTLVGKQTPCQMLNHQP